MTDPAGRVRAALDEDEAVANGLWFAARIPGKVPDFTAAGGPAAEAFWRHFDPARALREVAAVREIVRLCETETPETGGRPLAVRIMHLLGTVWDEQYREGVKIQAEVENERILRSWGRPPNGGEKR